MTADERHAALVDLEIFARACATLKVAGIEFYVEDLAAAHGIPGFGDDDEDDDEDEDDEPSVEQLAEAHRRRTESDDHSLVQEVLARSIPREGI